MAESSAVPSCLAQLPPSPHLDDVAHLQRMTAPANLLLRNAHRLAHRVPALKLPRHVLAEGLGGRAAHDHAGRGQALLGVLLEALIDGRVELGDDLARNFAFVSGNSTVGAR